MKDTVFHTKKTLNMRGRLLDISTPIVMGIINVTPDSFYAASRISNQEAVLRRVEQMLTEGASIIDLGGYSTRPGAQTVSIEEEIQRTIPCINIILQHFPESIISIDTFEPAVAREALDAGALMVNDVSGGEHNPEMYEIVGRYQVPYVLMHMRGTPQTMTSLNSYENIFTEIVDYFLAKLTKLTEHGVHDVILDPGFGFAKNIQQNFKLLQHLELFRILNCPLLVGISRKSTIYKTLDVPVEESLNGTTVLHTVALTKGAGLLRAHDVKEAKQCIHLMKELGYFVME